MDVGGAAPAGGIQRHRQHVPAAGVAGIGQRVAAGQAARKMQIQVRAGLDGRWRPAFAAQVQFDDGLGDPPQGMDAQRQALGSGVGHGADLMVP